MHKTNKLTGSSSIVSFNQIQLEETVNINVILSEINCLSLFSVGTLNNNTVFSM